MSLEHLTQLAALATEAADSVAGPVETYAAWVRETLAEGGTVYFAGNGGSAAHAQHIATEYVVRFRPVRRKAASALALSTDSSLLTAAGNDLGFEEVFARQIEAHARPGDLLVLVSTSGRSPNLVKAAEAATAAGVRSVALLGGDGGPLKPVVDLFIMVPGTEAAHIQELQLAIDHQVCDRIEPLL